MSIITRATEWNSGDTLTASALNAEFDNIISDYNGSITNANIAANAAITASKISGTAATLTGTETLTNKTLTTPLLTKPTVNASVQAYTTDSDASTVTFNMTASNVHTVTLGGNRTLAVSNVSTGQPFLIILRQDGSGSRTVTWWAGIKWTNATAPTLSTTANRYDVFSFIYDGSNYFGFTVGENLG